MIAACTEELCTSSPAAEPPEGLRENPVDGLLSAVRTALWNTERAQVVIAADLGISQKHLSMIRQGHADPSIDLLRRMCVLLNVDPLAQAATDRAAVAVAELRKAADEMPDERAALWLRARADAIDVTR